ncbi:MAG: hypothetical protein AB8G26_05130 [Ilumatobacter sp.]
MYRVFQPNELPKNKKRPAGSVGVIARKNEGEIKKWGTGVISGSDYRTFKKTPGFEWVKAADLEAWYEKKAMTIGENDAFVSRELGAQRVAKQFNVQQAANIALVNKSAAELVAYLAGSRPERPKPASNYGFLRRHFPEMNSNVAVLRRDLSRVRLERPEQDFAPLDLQSEAHAAIVEDAVERTIAGFEAAANEARSMSKAAARIMPGPPR